MRRSWIILALCLVCAATVLAYLIAHSRHSPITSILSQKTLPSVVTNPVEFVKSRVTGGIGVGLGSNAAKGLPLIAAVLAGSPAERAGLHAGDLILEVDGVGTTNLSTVQLADAIRGLSSGKVKLTVQRIGTNFECVVERTSWNTLRTLRTLSSNPYQ
jgi:C-terminal processing protease CtpA/Prc